jgi:hypothetical protein
MEMIKENEWCWYDNKYFVKVLKIEGNQIHFRSLCGHYINDWDYAVRFEPFIGQLPEIVYEDINYD